MKLRAREGEAREIASTMRVDDAPLSFYLFRKSRDSQNRGPLLACVRNTQGRLPAIGGGGRGAGDSDRRKYVNRNRKKKRYGILEIRAR